MNLKHMFTESDELHVQVVAGLHTLSAMTQKVDISSVFNNSLEKKFPSTAIIHSTLSERFLSPVKNQVKSRKTLERKSVQETRIEIKKREEVQTEDRTQETITSEEEVQTIRMRTEIVTTRNPNKIKCHL
tara:strand:- start:421 stop:810 length:390 start_codon:yes stop_codon:yes gene_type:complete